MNAAPQPPRPARVFGQEGAGCDESGSGEQVRRTREDTGIGGPWTGALEDGQDEDEERSSESGGQPHGADVPVPTP